MNRIKSKLFLWFSQSKILLQKEIEILKRNGSKYKVVQDTLVSHHSFSQKTMYKLCESTEYILRELGINNNFIEDNINPIFTCMGTDLKTKHNSTWRNNSYLVVHAICKGVFCVQNENNELNEFQVENVMFLS